MLGIRCLIIPFILIGTVGSIIEQLNTASLIEEVSWISLIVIASAQYISTGLLCLHFISWQSHPASYTELVYLFASEFSWK
jgi:hypothetical protein